MKQINKSIILLVGTIIMLFLGLIYAWSIFRVPLSEIFPTWTATQVSTTFTISIICLCTGGYLAGLLAKKILHKSILKLAAILILIGFVAISLFLSGSVPDRSLILLYVFYGIFVGLGVGLSYNTLLGVVAQHYPGKIGMATGILLLGFGSGGLILGSFVDFLCINIGINRTFFFIGCILAAVLFIGSIFIKITVPNSTAEEAGETQDTFNRVHSSIAKDYSLTEAVSRPPFWILCFWNISMSAGGLLVINSAAPIAIQFGIVAVIGLIVSVFNGIGRPLIGVLLDTIGRGRVMLFNSLVMLIGGIVLLCGSLTGNPIFIYIGFPFIGICYGGTPTLLAGVINNFYGPKNYQVILGIATFSLAVAATIGPIVSSKLQENSGGGYTTSFLMIIIAAIVAILFCLLLNAFSRKDGLEDI